MEDPTTTSITESNLGENLEMSKLLDLLNHFGMMNLGLLVGVNDVPQEAAEKISLSLSNVYVTIDILVYSNGLHVCIKQKKEERQKDEGNSGKAPRTSFFLKEFLKQKIKYSDEDVARNLKREPKESDEEYYTRIIGNLARLFRDHLMPVIEGKEWPQVDFDWGEYK